MKVKIKIKGWDLMEQIGGHFNTGDTRIFEGELIEEPVEEKKECENHNRIGTAGGKMYCVECGIEITPTPEEKPTEKIEELSPKVAPDRWGSADTEMFNKINELVRGYNTLTERINKK